MMTRPLKENDPVAWRRQRLVLLEDTLQRIAELLSPLEARIIMAREMAMAAVADGNVQSEDADDDL